MDSFNILKPPLKPLIETKSKLSSEVWYSLYVPYFDLMIEAMGKSIPGELYCLSSDPLSKKEYSLYLIFNFLKAFRAALSDKEFLYFEGKKE